MSSIKASELSELWIRNAQVPGVISTTVQELIAQRASIQGDNPAIVAWDGNYTYAELMRLASKLAKCLSQQIGQHSGKVLPIVMSKSKWMPIAMVGALLGGWGIAPLDIRTPAARLAEILDILDPPCILTISESTIVIDTTVPIFAVDHLGLEYQIFSGIERLAENASTNIAAVVFTSGSTGSPKGVMLNPECISTSAVCGSQILQLGRSSRLFQFSSFSFDISLHETFMTLVAGGCLCIPSETQRLNNLVAAINTMQANCICTTPSIVMSALAEAIVSTPIKLVVLTGEALTSRIGPLFDMDISLFNWYGATECPIVSLAPIIKENSVSSQIRSKHPGNCWVVQSDNPDVLCGFGEVGELLVESPMLTMGYLNAPGQTETAFVVDPAWLTNGYGSVMGRRGRLYRTGDLVRSNRDWTFDYIGRKDTMVKIRGQRVDLSAIEFRIWNYLQSGAMESRVRVREVLVESTISNQNTQNASISCFLYLECQLELQPQYLPQKHLAKSTNLPSIYLYAPDKLLQGLQAEIDRALRTALPDYMIPSLYFQLSEVPFTPSGKIDRKLLRSLALQISSEDLMACRIFPQEGYVLPHNDTEVALQRLWADTLGLDAAVIHTNISFLQYGGDSLSAIAISKALRTEFSLSIQVPQLLRRETTIQHLATLVESHKNGQIVDGPQMDISTSLGAWVTRLGSTSINLPSADSLGSRGSQVLLTGATGYLGTHILGELFNNHQVRKIIIIVRAANIDIARERVRKVAVTAGWWKEGAFSRIEAWLGDLAEPRLGLQEEKWAKMSNIDIIIHNGAVVNYSASYDLLERANVISTFHLLEAALQSQHLRNFVYISGGIKQGLHQTDEEYLQTLNESEGYSQAKYVSEQLTLAAGRLYDEVVHPSSTREDEREPANTGRTFIVIKPGYIIGDQAAGLSNTDDYIWRLVAGAVRMGCFPSDPPDYWLDIAEVTYVAKYVARQAQRGILNDSSGPMTPPRSIHSGCSSPSSEDDRENGTMKPTVVFHDMSRGLPVSEFWNAIQSQAQISLKQLDWDSWVGQANADVDRDKEAHPLWAIQLHLGPALGDRITAKEVKIRSTEEFDTSGEIEAAVRRSVEYLCNIQFIVLPFKEGSLNSPPANWSYPSNSDTDSSADDDEHLAQRRVIGSAQGKHNHTIISRSKLRY
ncbi:putative nonribosomal peptide synthase [Trichoderma afarasin]